MSDPIRSPGGVSPYNAWDELPVAVDDIRGNRNVAPPPPPSPAHQDQGVTRRLHLSIPRQLPGTGLPSPGSEPRRGPRGPEAQTTGGLSISVMLTSPQGTFRWGAGDVLIGNDLDMAMPEIPATAPANADGTPGLGAEGLQRRTVRFAYTRALLPNGVEVQQGTGRLTLLHDGSQIRGVLQGSIVLDPGATTVLRAKDGPVAMTGHRGEPAELTYGGAMMRDGQLVGLMGNSEASIDGLRLQTQDLEATYRFEPPGAYTLGRGMIVRGAPADRAVSITGEGVDVYVLEGRTHLTSGSVDVRFGREVQARDGAVVRALRDLVDPRPEAGELEKMPRGEIILRPTAPDARLFVDGPRPDDFTQGALGDCFLLAPLMAVAHFRPELIEDMVRDNGDGTYSVRFYSGRSPVTRTVDADQYFATQPYRYQIYSRTKLPNEVWAPVIEKAYASMRDQGFHSLDAGGFANQTLTELTNMPTARTTVASSTHERMFEALRAAVAGRRPAVAAVHKTGDGADAALRDRGLLNNHAYAVLDAYEEGGRRFVVLRNPWGTMDFSSPDYEADLDLNGDGAPEGVDGTFRMSVEDFASHFTHFDVLQVGAAQGSTPNGHTPPANAAPVPPSTPRSSEGLP